MAGATTAGREDRRKSASGPPPTARRRRLPRRRTLVLLLVLVLLAGGGGGWALYGSDRTRIERVSVDWTSDQRELTADRILEAAAVPVGSPMASLDKGAVRERLLAELPRLKSVDVVRAWPRGVGLKVTEREPEVLMPREGGFAEVDAEGVVYAEAAEARPGVPLLELEPDRDASLRRFGEDRIREGAVTVAAALPDAVRRDTRVIRVRSYDSVTLELTGDRTVRWGSPEEPGAKVRSLSLLMKAAGNAEYFDVSVPSAPAAAEG